jgi:hypothetical protein
VSFRVPEAARMIVGPMGSRPHAGLYGAFMIESPEPGWQLIAIATDGQDPDVPDAAPWEHVSVHARRGLRSRIPSWREMCHIKDLFWEPDDLVVQFHPRRADYVNRHEHVLHLWRYRLAELPTPPTGLV